MDISTSIDDLKCSICHNLLSFFPIYITVENANICGRCPIPEDIPCTRNKVYETLAEEVLFPCRYQEQGCCETLSPKEVPLHETNCMCRICECPTKLFTKCEEQVPYCSLTEHCRNTHSDILLENGEFEVQLDESKWKYNILEYEDEIWIVRRKYEKKNNLLKFSICYCENQTIKETMSAYEICLKCSNRELLIKSASNTNTICLDSLTNFREDSFLEISGTISLEKKDTIHQEILSLLKCSYCSEYVTPTANISSEIMCSNCVYLYEADNTIVNDTIVDRITKLLNYPCKYKEHGCRLSLPLQQIQNHQTSCCFGTQFCPVRNYVNCKWSGLEKDLHTHILTQHQNIIVSFSPIRESLSGLQKKNYYPSSRKHSNFTKCYIFKLSQYFFIVLFTKRDQQYFWTVQMIGKFRDMFKYEVEIGDRKKTGRKMIVGSPCSKWCKDSQLNLDESCCLRHEQIQHLIEDNVISFTIRVLKK